MESLTRRLIETGRVQNLRIPFLVATASHPVAIGADIRLAQTVVNVSRLCTTVNDRLGMVTITGIEVNRQTLP